MKAETWQRYLMPEGTDAADGDTEETMEMVRKRRVREKSVFGGQ